MLQFIHLKNFHGYNETVRINVNNITVYRRDKSVNKTVIHLVGDKEYVEVNETPEEIDKHIEFLNDRNPMARILNILDSQNLTVRSI